MPIQRDLIGYGRDRPDIVWPNGARLAISLSLNFEEGAELSIEEGDGETEQFGEVPSVQAPGVRDLVQEQTFDYGMRVGYWRFLEAFARHGFRATLQICGRAAERVPGLARAGVEAGHEPSAHGWRWLPHSRYTDPAAERADIVRTRAAIEQATGRMPLGHFSRGSQSPWTRDLLGELGFSYDSNALNDDLPYWARLDCGRDMLVLPYNFDTNDMRYWYPNGFVRPDDFSAYCLMAVDTLLGEADRGRSAMVTIGFHTRISGRPARFGAVELILRHLADLGDRVWVATRGDIADHFRQCHPTP
ncbi:MAG: polysaccharide deacetylase family protein [Devosia sp.]|nr:polysaccharide deacetylase family protein [Devosia sp.]